MTYEDLKRFADPEPITTERLTLRKLTRADAQDVYKYASDGRVTEYLLWSPHTTVQHSRRYLMLLEKKYRRCEFYDWGVEYNGHIIGTCGFTSFSVENQSAEVGYVLGYDAWGQGIAAEALRAVIKYGFEVLGLNRIEGRYMKGNDRSLSVMKKCAMTYEGMLRSSVFAKGAYRDVCVCSILKSEYNNAQKLGILP